MQEGKRQKQVAALLQDELSRIFQYLGLNMIDGAIVTISSVKITPDLFDARVHLSFFPPANAASGMKKIEEHAWDIKKELVSAVKHQLRSMPQLNYFLDDSLDQVDKMEALFRKIKDQDNPE